MSTIRMIHTVKPGDLLTFVNGDGNSTEPFVLAEPIVLTDSLLYIFVWRVDNVPLMLDRLSTLTSGVFIRHDQPA